MPGALTAFLVNTYSSVYQGDPFITDLRDGGFIVTLSDTNAHVSGIQTNDGTAILKHIVGFDTINNFDLINNARGQRVTQLEDNPITVPALTIVENGDVSQSGAFNEDYVVSVEITQFQRNGLNE